ncbi:hypothetical protein FB451DRAFT_1417001 [Mycena latifolia]|nr:hypothetical protein FB451DRAFT_1417001 [Mycena latifolia]
MRRELFNVSATSSPLLTLIMVRFTIFLALSTLLISTSAFPTDSNDYSDPHHSDRGKCHKEGEMKCVGDAFATCDHGYFVIRRCGKGTACRPFGGSILCDYRHDY